MSDKGHFQYDPSAPAPMYGQQDAGAQYQQQPYYGYPDSGYGQHFPPPGPAQPYYQPQYGGYTAPGYAPGGEDGVGTAALVLGIIGLATCLTPASIAAIVCGHIGMRKGREGVAGNEGQAKAGAIMGYVGVGIVAAAVLLYIVIIVGAVAAGASGSTGSNP